MTMDPREIAAGLTKGQKRCISKLAVTPRLAGLNSFNANAAFNMIRLGLTELGFDRTLLRDTYRLTRLGLAVRAELEKGR